MIIKNLKTFIFLINILTEVFIMGIAIEIPNKSKIKPMTPPWNQPGELLE